ncbi:hypothetical protein V1478_015715 [Vespula squamosa]|uniref:Uncharacterized protein n=1 Tax=Vespula squamosa TaxID=30214 RepID=A0ABD2A4A4_VESSQ
MISTYVRTWVKFISQDSQEIRDLLARRDNAQYRDEWVFSRLSSSPMSKTRSANSRRTFLHLSKYLINTTATKAVAEAAAGAGAPIATVGVAVVVIVVVVVVTVAAEAAPRGRLGILLISFPISQRDIPTRRTH